MLYRLLFGGEKVSSYTVFERPDPPADRLDRADGLMFVKDGFSFPAALFAPLWLLAHRAWLALALYVAAAAAVLAIAHAFAIEPVLAMIALGAIHLLVGYEAGLIERGSLVHRGWNEISDVTGTGAHDCERRFFDLWLRMQPGLRTGSTSEAAAITARSAAATSKSAPPFAARLVMRALGRRG